MDYFNGAVLSFHQIKLHFGFIHIIYNLRYVRNPLTFV